IKTDVRVISATNKVLEDEIKKGQFRTDLYYRLNVFPISVSPLRDRKPDILPIAEYYNKIYSEKFKKPLKSFSTMSKKQLMNYSWPGNIRELENVIERAVITSDSSDLEVEALSDTNNILDEELPLGELEKNYIIQMLEKANWKVSGTNGAASRLKIHPETLRSKMRKLGINRKNQL
ncbi:MAG: sigma-54-dependent Fis family transcriptional regulator, partial [Ignavibacteria bacterium]